MWIVAVAVTQRLERATEYPTQGQNVQPVMDSIILSGQ